MSQINIGLIGFGVVGSGFYEILIKENSNCLYNIKRIAVKNIQKERIAPHALFTDNALELVCDPTIQIVIELIDDAQEAYLLVKEALLNKKHVVSANKKMLSDHIEELSELAKIHGCSLLYEAAVAGSIPIIRNLENYYAGGFFSQILGIVNGSTNYILSEMQNKQLDYTTALKQAQDLGFAESDPSLDVSGADAQSKLKILVYHAFGSLIGKEDIPTIGIEQISRQDLLFAKEQKLVIKLLASCKYNDQTKLSELSVLPTFLPYEHKLAQINGASNGILVGHEDIGYQLFEGAGAGALATGSAVFTDLKAISSQYAYRFESPLKVYEVQKQPLFWYLRAPFSAIEKIEDVRFLEQFDTNSTEYRGLISCTADTAQLLAGRNGHTLIRFLGS